MPDQATVLFKRGPWLKLAMTVLGTGTILSNSSPARSEEIVSIFSKDEKINRENAILTDGKAAIIEGMLARSSNRNSSTPILFDNELGPFVSKWASTHKSVDFLVTPLDIAGKTYGIAFFDPYIKDKDPFNRIADVINRSGGQFIDGGSVSLDSYRVNGIKELPSSIQLGEMQMLSLHDFLDHAHVQSKSKDPNGLEQAARSTGAGVLQAVRNIYYGQKPKDLTHNILTDIANKTLNKTIDGILKR